MELSVREERRLNFLSLAYAQAVEEAGGMALHFPSLVRRETVEEAVSMIDGLVLAGGADIHPSYYGEEITEPISLSPNQRTDFDLSILKAALEAGRAVLAICHGMQIVNVSLGGTLYQDLARQVPGSIGHRSKEGDPPARHEVRVEPGSRLSDLLDGRLHFEVCSTHHQAVKVLGKGLRVNARSPDGLVEGLELPGFPRLIAVQWHPEKDPESEVSRTLFRALVKMAEGGA